MTRHSVPPTYVVLFADRTLGVGSWKYPIVKQLHSTIWIRLD